MKTAVLISGELRFLEECLPTLGFINDDVDVYVSTWDKTVIKNEYLGIEIEEDVTEERIRSLIPNAKILIEPLSCYSSIKYSDRMVHRWIAGWHMIESSGIKYDRVTVTRPDLFFAQVREFKYNDDVDIEALCSNKSAYLQDCLFSMKWEFAKRFLGTLNVEDWTKSDDNDIHTWMYTAVSKHSPNCIGNIFADKWGVFFRATNNEQYKELTFDNAIKRELDWRDSVIISHALRSGLPFSKIETSWPASVVEDAILAHHSGRMNRAASANTLLILCGKVRNYHSVCLSIPLFGDADIGIVGWNSEDAHRLRHILRCDMHDLYSEDFHCTRISQDKTSRFYDNVEYMLLHLEHALNLASTTSHERIIITRPDFLVLADAIEMQSSQCLNLMYDHNTDSAGDCLWVFSRSLLEKVKLLPNKIRELSVSMNSTNIHAIIPVACRELGIDIERAPLKNECIQRDTFKFLWDDHYSKEYFTAVMCDSAAWWRRTHNSVYNVYLNGLI